MLTRSGSQDPASPSFLVGEQVRPCGLSVYKGAQRTQSHTPAEALCAPTARAQGVDKKHKESDWTVVLLFFFLHLFFRLINKNTKIAPVNGVPWDIPRHVCFVWYLCKAAIATASDTCHFLTVKALKTFLVAFWDASRNCCLQAPYHATAHHSFLFSTPDPLISWQTISAVLPPAPHHHQELEHLLFYCPSHGSWEWTAFSGKAQF